MIINIVVAFCIFFCLLVLREEEENAVGGCMEEGDCSVFAKQQQSCELKPVAA
jgi:hypothetical protein